MDRGWDRSSKWLGWGETQRNHLSFYRTLSIFNKNKKKNGWIMSAIVHNSWEEVSSVDVDTGQWKVSVSRHRWSTVHQIPPWWEKTPNATLSHSTLPQGGGRCAMADGNATFYSCLIKSHFLTYWMNVSVKSKMMKKKHQRKKKHKRKQIKNKKARIRFFFVLRRLYA